MQNILLGIVSGLILTCILTMDRDRNKDKDNSKKSKEPLININPPIDMLGGNAPANLTNTTYSKTKLGWIENSRNNRNFKNYPPCFNLSFEAQKLFDLLENNDVILKHKVLLEVYSMILCQVTYLKSKLCPQTMLIDRLKDLDSFGALRYTNHYNNLVSYVSKKILYLSSPMTLEFLNKALYLIDKEIDQINLSQEKIDAIKKLNKQICSYAFPIIAKEC